ncbi:hypothetical protein PRIPAC_76002, partial [Pristionchus pacificus]|uniref:Uncharacterized protein n=1 Tax=Pristionchus pacificus TaxID=54126 RepID=A0A2A6C1V3_PRIPA
KKCIQANPALLSKTAFSHLNTLAVLDLIVYHIFTFYFIEYSFKCDLYCLHCYRMAFLPWKNSQYQINSMVIDTFSDFYSPIVITHKGIFYSNSLLSTAIPFSVYWSAGLLLVIELDLGYLLCVYYRRTVVVPQRRRFNFFGWRRIIFYVALHIIVLSDACAMLHFMHECAKSSEKHIPSDSEWVRTKATHMIMLPDTNLVYAHSLIIPLGTGLVLVTIIMLIEIVSEVRRGMHWASMATQRYQRLAVRSLLLQGLLPTLGYAAPAVILASLHFAPHFCAITDIFDEIATIFSPLLFLFLTKHTFINSLTILYCSPSYRKKIRVMFSKSRISHITRMGERRNE